MGMAGGAYKGDMERARLALQAQSIANQAAAQRRAAALREQELNQRQQMIDAANRERQEAAERASMHGKAGRKWLGGSPEGAQVPQGGTATASVPMGGQALGGQRSPYSVSAFDLGAAARQRANDQRLMALERQNNTLGQFQQVVNMERQQAAARKAQGQSTVASLMKMSMMNGGVAPMAALQLATRQMGFDGKTAAIGGAGFTANGDFFLDFVQKDAQTGQMSRATNLIGRADQGRIYYGQQGIFDNADRAAWRQQMLGARYSDQEINQLAGLDASAIEGLDDAGRQRLAAGFVDPAGGSDWKRDIAMRKQHLAARKQYLEEQKFATKLERITGKPTTRERMSGITRLIPMYSKMTETYKDEFGEEHVVKKYKNPEDVIRAASNAYDDLLKKIMDNKDPSLGQQNPNPTADNETPTAPAGSVAPGGEGAGVTNGLPQTAREILSSKELADALGELGGEGNGGAAHAARGASGEDGAATLAEGGEAPAAPAEGGAGGGAPAEGAAPAGGGDGAPAPAPVADGGDGAPPPPPPPPPAEGGAEGDAPAGDAPAGDAPGNIEGDTEEDQALKNNPFAKWIKRSKRK